jgi:hypothetical protein
VAQPPVFLEKLAALTPRPRVVGRHPHIGVQIEPFQMGLTRPPRGHGLEIHVAPESPHPRPRARAQRHPPLDRSADDPGQCGGLLGEPILQLRRVAAGFQAPAHEEPPDPVADRGEQLRHLGARSAGAG